jgi:hypothetical protein
MFRVEDALLPGQCAILLAGSRANWQRFTASPVCVSIHRQKIAISESVWLWGRAARTRESRPPPFERMEATWPPQPPYVCFVLVSLYYPTVSYINILLVTFSANPHTLTLPLKNGDSRVIPEKLALSRVAAASVSLTSPFAASVA